MPAAYKWIKTAILISYSRKMRFRKRCSCSCLPLIFNLRFMAATVLLNHISLYCSIFVKQNIKYFYNLAVKVIKVNQIINRYNLYLRWMSFKNPIVFCLFIFQFIFCACTVNNVVFGDKGKIWNENIFRIWSRNVGN